MLGTAQQGLDHPADALLLELVGELVEMHHPAPDEPFARFADGLYIDRARPVAARLVAEAGFVGQRVHEPRLAAGGVPDFGLRRVAPCLSRLPGVLHEERLDLAGAEVSETQGLGADVEGAAAENHGVFGARPDAVVAHVADAAQDDALRKPVRPAGVAAAQLSQHRQQGVPDQRVDLVDQQHQGLGGRGGPKSQCVAQGTVWTAPLQAGWPDAVERVVAA